MKKNKKWDVDNISPARWELGQASCFKLWSTKGKMTALLDADMFPYIVGFLHDMEDWTKLLVKADKRKLKTETKKWYKFLWKNSRDVINHCDSLVNSWVVGANCDSALLYLTEGQGNFRYDVAFSKEYKGTRKQEKPPYYSLIKWHLKEKHNAICSLTEEADDLMAIEQYSRNQKLVLEGAEQGSRESKLFSNTCIVTKDKDLRIIAGWHSNPLFNKGERFWVDTFGWLEPIYYPEGHKLQGRMKKLDGAGQSFFYAQLLMGDSVDNYLGLPMHGMKAAYEALKDCKKVKHLHKQVVAMYKSKYRLRPFVHEAWTGKKIQVNWKDMLVEQGRLAWMQRRPAEKWMPEHNLLDSNNWKRKSDKRGEAWVKET